MNLIKNYFLGFSQIIFSENPLSGFLFFIAIFLYSWEMAIGAFLASLINALLVYKKESYKKGLLTYNSALVGLAIIFFMGINLLSLIVLIISSILSSYLTLYFDNILKKIELPLLTFPFVFVTLLVLLFVPREPLLLKTISINFYLDSILNSLSQIFLVENPYSGFLILLALFISNYKWGVYALVASVSSTFLSIFLHFDPALIKSGALGFNSVLVMISFFLFYKLNFINFITALLLSLTSIFVFILLNKMLGILSLPSLTFSFVLTIWIFLITKNFLKRIN